MRFYNHIFAPCNKSLYCSERNPFLLFFYTLFSLFWLAGCATRISPASLKKPINATPIKIEKDFSYNTSENSKVKRGLRAGVYTPELEDNAGVFYRGNGKAVIWQSFSEGDKSIGKMTEGGVWFPKNNSSRVRFKLYRYLGGDNINQEAVNDAVINQVVNSPTRISPIQGGIAGGIAAAIVLAMVESEKGKIAFLSDPPPNIDIDKFISKGNVEPASEDSHTGAATVKAESLRETATPPGQSGTDGRLSPSWPAQVTSGYAEIADIDKLAELNPRAREAYERFLSKPLPRAFSLSETGGWWISWGRTPKDPMASPDPAIRAIPDCENLHKRRCIIYAIDNIVVYRPDSSFAIEN